MNLKAAILLGCAIFMHSTAALAYTIGVFPEFQAYWETQSGPFVASAIDLQTRPPGAVYPSVDHQVTTTSGEVVQGELTIGETSTSGMSSTELGANHVYASGTRIGYVPNIGNDTATASAVSLWKDIFTIDGTGTISLDYIVDGTLPLVDNVPNIGGAVTELFLSIYSNDGREVMVAHFSEPQQYDYAGWDWFFLDPSGMGVTSWGNEIFPRDGDDVFNLTLQGMLAAGTYEIRSEFYTQISANDYVMSVTSDFYNTARFDTLTLSPGMTLTSASGLLVDSGSGEYRYVSSPSPIPEPTSIALFALGLVSLMVRRRRPVNKFIGN